MELRAAIKAGAEQPARYSFSPFCSDCPDLFGTTKPLTLPEKCFVLAAFHDELRGAEAFPPIMEWESLGPEERKPLGPDDEIEEYWRHPDFALYCMFRHYGGQAADWPDEALRENVLRRYVREVSADLSQAIEDKPGWPPFPLPADCGDVLSAAMRGIRWVRKNFIPEHPFFGKQLKAATNVALDIRLAWSNEGLELREVPLAQDSGWPTEQDFIRLEQWYSDASVAIAKEIAGGRDKTQVTAQGEKAEGNAQDGDSAGRPTGSGDTDAKADRKTAQKWARWRKDQRGKGNYTASFDQYASEKGLNGRAVALAVDRDRKRKAAREARRSAT